jgi:prepilin-type N-terminal cleavage/methylation domain-containing protein
MFIKKREVIKMFHTRYSAGFSLIELLIVVVIIGILAAFAVIGYHAVLKETKDTIQVFRLGDFAKAQENFKVVKGRRRYGSISELCQSKLLPDNVVKFTSSCGQEAINGWIIDTPNDSDPAYLRHNFRAVLKKVNHQQSDGPVFCIHSDGVLRRAAESTYLECTEETPPADQ